MIPELIKCLWGEHLLGKADVDGICSGTNISSLSQSSLVKFWKTRPSVIKVYKNSSEVRIQFFFSFNPHLPWNITVSYSKIRTWNNTFFYLSSMWHNIKCLLCSLLKNTGILIFHCDILRPAFQPAEGHCDHYRSQLFSFLNK